MKKKELKKAIKELKSTTGLLYSKLDSSSLNTTDESELDVESTMEHNQEPELDVSDKHNNPVVTQNYKGCERRYAQSIPHYKNSQDSLNLYEHVYLNLFGIEIPNDNDYFQFLLKEITSCDIDVDDKRIYLEFNENLSFENKLLVFPILMKMRQDGEIIRDMRISIYNRKGDVILQYDLSNVYLSESNDFENIHLSYESTDAILEHRIQFNFLKCDIKYI